MPPPRVKGHAGSLRSSLEVSCSDAAIPQLQSLGVDTLLPNDAAPRGDRRRGLPNNLVALRTKHRRKSTWNGVGHGDLGGSITAGHPRRRFVSHTSRFNGSAAVRGFNGVPIAVRCDVNSADGTWIPCRRAVQVVHPASAAAGSTDIFFRSVHSMAIPAVAQLREELGPGGR